MYGEIYTWNKNCKEEKQIRREEPTLLKLDKWLHFNFSIDYIYSSNP